MPGFLWICLALLGGLAAVMIAVRVFGAQAPLPSEVELPATRLQRWSRRGLIIGALPAAAAAAMVVHYGTTRLMGDDRLRLTFTFLILAVAVVFLAVAFILRTRSRGAAGAALDERDRAILDRAPAFQAPAMLVTLAIWMIGLTQRYHGSREVPLEFLYLIFWSVWVVDLLALPVGVLLGYRRR